MTIDELIENMRSRGTNRELFVKDEAFRNGRRIFIQSSEDFHRDSHGWYALWSESEPDEILLHENEVEMYGEEGYEEQVVTVGRKPYSYTLEGFLDTFLKYLP